MAGIKPIGILVDVRLLLLCVNQVMNNREAVDLVKRFMDPQTAAKQLIAEAVKRESEDDISCVVVRFKM
jgi:serine/threonine protein phosphatase PrpC